MMVPLMRCRAAFLVIAVLTSPSAAKPLRPFAPAQNPPFNARLSNIAPLAFGMSEADAARALGQPLVYLNGRPGDEVLLAYVSTPVGSILPRSDRLYLQFRRGRLTGLKGDYGRNWMWRRSDRIKTWDTTSN